MFYFFGNTYGRTAKIETLCVILPRLSAEVGHDSTWAFNGCAHVGVFCVIYVFFGH